MKTVPNLPSDNFLNYEEIAGPNYAYQAEELVQPISSPLTEMIITLPSPSTIDFEEVLVSNSNMDYTQIGGAPRLVNQKFTYLLPPNLVSDSISYEIIAGNIETKILKSPFDKIPFPKDLILPA